MAVTEQQKFMSSDVGILSELMLLEAAKIFPPFAKSLALVQSASSLRKNVTAQQSAGLLKVSLEQNLAEMVKFQKSLGESRDLMQELDLLGLSVENRPNVEMLEAQATHLQQQSKEHIDRLDSSQPALGDIIKQTAVASANLSVNIKKILETHGATDVDK